MKNAAGLFRVTRKGDRAACVSHVEKTYIYFSD